VVFENDGSHDYLLTAADLHRRQHRSFIALEQRYKSLQSTLANVLVENEDMQRELTYGKKNDN
jgi:hypothetical protein|tara:strand:- start:356 stop:544 length:189 start_codon:yes stop_codon:yes gene_type:complete